MKKNIRFEIFLSGELTLEGQGEDLEYYSAEILNDADRDCAVSRALHAEYLKECGEDPNGERFRKSFSCWERKVLASVDLCDAYINYEDLPEDET